MASAAEMGLAPVVVSPLLEKLHNVMKSVDFIAKDKTNDHYKYSYASEEAIKRTLHPLLVRERVLFMPISQRVVGVDKSVTTLAVTFRFTDLDSGEFLDVEAIGSGADSQDKGPYKALTGAIKYQLTSTFLIPTGNDPEGDAGKKQSSGPKRTDAPSLGQRMRDPNAVISEPQLKRLYALANKSGRSGEEAKAIITRYGFASAKDITQDKYDDICYEVEHPER